MSADPPGLILAAGESSRFGSPKVLQSFAGVPFTIRIIHGLQAMGIGQIYLMVGGEAGKVLSRLPPEIHGQVAFRFNPNYVFGQLSTLQTGIRELSPGVCGVVICLIDQPQILPATYLELKNRLTQDPEAIWIPEYRRTGGHPIYLPSAMFREIGKAEASRTTLRDIIRRHPNRVKRFRVDDAGICEDIDTPDDLRRLEQRYSEQQDCGKSSTLDN